MPDGRVGEVISVVARRRSWTTEQKLALVEEVSRPGASVAAIADRHGVSRSLLFDWRRQVREGTMPGVTRTEGAPTLVPVRVVPDAPTPRSSIARSGRPAASVEVVLGNGRILRVAETIRPEVLRQLAAALDG